MGLMRVRGQWYQLPKQTHLYKIVYCTFSNYFKINNIYRGENDIIECIEKNFELLKNVSRERIFEEMNKMFNVNSAKTFKLMIDFQKVFEFIFEECKVDLSAILKEIK